MGTGLERLTDEIEQKSPEAAGNEGQGKSAEPEANRSARGHSGRSMRTRILGWSFIPTTIILLAVALVIFYAYEQVTEELVVQRNREVTRLSASQLATELDGYADVLGSLARRPEMYRAVPAEQRDLLDELNFRLAVFDAGTVVLTPSGNVGPSYPARPDISGADWSPRSYFRDMLRSPQRRYSDILQDGRNDAEVIAVAVPILGEQGEFNGVIAGMFDIGEDSTSSLYGNIAKLRIGEGRAYLVDAGGRVIYHAQAELIGRDLADEPIVARALAGRNGAVRTRDVDGQDVVAAYAPVPGTGWGLISVEPWSSVSATGREYRSYLVVLLALGLALPTIVVFLGVRRITQPLASMSEAAAEVAAGNFDRTINVDTGDELEELAEQFNLMSARLRESYTDLEQRVADRTRELATVNDLASVASRSLDLRTILVDSLTTTLAAVEVSTGCALVEGPESGMPEIITCQNADESLTETLLSYANQDWRHREVEADPVPLIVHTLEIDSEGFARAGFPTLASVPLLSKDRVLGLLYLLGPKTWDPGDDECRLLAAVGRQVGVAVDNARLYAQAEQSAATTERNRLARDLHDAVSQTLFSATLIAEVLPRIWDKDPEQGRERLEELRRLTRGALAEMRSLLLELRPTALEEAELADLLRQLVEANSVRSRIRIDLTLEGSERVPRNLKVPVYRIVQEALNNVTKHSDAGRVSVRLVADEQGVRLAVSDDGKGFDPALVTTDHLGLSIMSERARALEGELELETAPGEGTRVLVTWPTGQVSD